MVDAAAFGRKATVAFSVVAATVVVRAAAAWVT